MLLKGPSGINFPHEDKKLRRWIRGPISDYVIFTPQNSLGKPEPIESKNYVEPLYYRGAQYIELDLGFG